MRKLKVIYFHSDKISLIGIPYAFHLSGHDVIDTEYRPHLNGLNEEDVVAVEKEIKKAGGADIVFTYDFIPAVSVACEHSRIIYLAWVYDCPQVELFRPEVGNSYSFIIVFDKKYYEYMKSLETVKNLYYFPLAADMDLFASTEISAEDEEYYRADVSFLGRLYDKEYVRTVFDMCTQYEKDEIERIVTEILSGRGQDMPRGKAGDALIESVFSYFGNTSEDSKRIDRRYYVESLFLAPKCNEAIRKEILNTIAKDFSVVLYSEKLQYDDLDPRIILRGQQEYMSQMPKVFYMSKVNLNITSKSIESGIPQRVWDILAVGGFCLTDNRPELEEYFEPGHDLVVYHDISECNELIGYYLKHEKERLKIALSGYKRVQQTGDMRIRIQRVIETIKGFV